MNKKWKFRYKIYRNTPFRPEDGIYRDQISRSELFFSDAVTLHQFVELACGYSCH